MKKYLLDTNVLLRFLLDDHPELSRAAAGLFQQAADEKCLLILTDLGIAEAVWVLTSFYKLERQKVAESLAKLLLKVVPPWSPYSTPWPASRRPIAIFSTAI